MTLVRFVLALSLVTLLLFSNCLPTSAAADHEGGDGVLIPFKRLLLNLPVKAGGERVADVDKEELFSSLQKKLRVHMRKVRAGGTGAAGVATRARGKTSSAVRVTQLSFSQFGSVLGCSLFLGLIML